MTFFGSQQWHSFAVLFQGWDLSIDPSISEVIVVDYSDVYILGCDNHFSYQLPTTIVIDFRV